ncbi:MAG TPA: hypothetical protein VFY31_09865 [Macromonas sp.]|nr:hypothetical protein [Macromonas sp.]
MPLVVDQLSLWTIGFKWAGLEPNRTWLRIPPSAGDNFRTLLSEILNLHLDCLSLAPEKYAGDDPELAKFHIRYWLDDINAAIHGHHFNRKLLKWAVVEREAFRDWCERRSIPLPEFWFPPGWTEYRWPENDPAHELDLESPIDEGITAASSPVETESNDSKDTTKWRPCQRHRVACQVIAEVLWKNDHSILIPEMARDERVLQLGGGAFYSEDTIKDWIKEVAPEAIQGKKGRPASKK